MKEQKKKENAERGGRKERKYEGVEEKRGSRRGNDE